MDEDRRVWGTARKTAKARNKRPGVSLIAPQQGAVLEGGLCPRCLFPDGGPVAFEGMAPLLRKQGQAGKATSGVLLNYLPHVLTSCALWESDDFQPQVRHRSSSALLPQRKDGGPFLSPESVNLPVPTSAQCSLTQQTRFFHRARAIPLLHRRLGRFVEFKMAADAWDRWPPAEPRPRR